MKTSMVKTKFDIYDVAWSKDGSYIAVSCFEKGVFIIGTDPCQAPFVPRCVWPVHNIAWNIAWNTIAGILVVGVDHRSVKIFDVAANHVVSSLDHSTVVNSAAWSPDGSLVVTGCYDGSIKIWSAKSGKEIGGTYLTNSYVASVSWSPNSEYITAICGNCTRLNIYRARDLIGSTPPTKRIFKLKRFGGHGIAHAAWRPDSKRIVVSATLGYLWEVNVDDDDGVDNNSHLLLSSDISSIIRPEYSPDGLCVVAGARANTVKVIDAVNNRLMDVWRGHSTPATCYSWSPDGRHLVTGSSDQTIIIWSLK